MSLTFGFYNSINGDRTYNASELSKLFEGIINDGIFMSIGDHLVVSPSTGMTILVGTGRAWFNNTWTNNDSQLLLSIDPAAVVLNRIDIVVLEIDTTPEVRANSIKVIKGSAASSPSPPSLIVSDMVNQYPLAHVYIGSGVTTITQSNITNKIGTSACPFISGIMSTINIDSLVAQWEAQWAEWFANETSSGNNQMSQWMGEKQSEFNTWFGNLQTILDGDVATKLAEDILSLQDRFKVLAREYSVYQNMDDSDGEPIEDSYGTIMEGKIVYKIA